MAEKVNVGMQVVLTIVGLFIPFVWIYPFYKIKKITRMIVIRLLIFLAGLVPMLVYVLAVDEQQSSEFGGYFIIPFLVAYVIVIFVDIPFVIKWSRTWNRDIDSMES